jgi:hypothetical protein
MPKPKSSRKKGATPEGEVPTEAKKGTPYRRDEVAPVAALLMALGKADTARSAAKMAIGLLEACDAELSPPPQCPKTDIPKSWTQLATYITGDKNETRRWENLKEFANASPAQTVLSMVQAEVLQDLLEFRNTTEADYYVSAVVAQELKESYEAWRSLQKKPPQDSNKKGFAKRMSG